MFTGVNHVVLVVKRICCQTGNEACKLSALQNSGYFYVCNFHLEFHFFNASEWGNICGWGQVAPHPLLLDLSFFSSPLLFSFVSLSVNFIIVLFVKKQTKKNNLSLPPFHFLPFFFFHSYLSSSSFFSFSRSINNVFKLHKTCEK